VDRWKKGVRAIAEDGKEEGGVKSVTEVRGEANSWGGETYDRHEGSQEAVTLTPLIYPANSFWSVGRPQLIGCCACGPRDHTLLGSTQLRGRKVQSRRTDSGTAQGDRNIPKITGGSDHFCSVSSLFRTIRRCPINI